MKTKKTYAVSCNISVTIILSCYLSQEPFLLDFFVYYKKANILYCFPSSKQKPVQS